MIGDWRSVEGHISHQQGQSPTLLRTSICQAVKKMAGHSVCSNSDLEGIRVIP